MNPLRALAGARTLLASCSAVLLCAACVNTAYPVGPAPAAGLLEQARAAAPALPPTAAPAPGYLLQAGDSFDVKLFYTPELNESVLVRPDGRIALQLVGEVQAAGLAPAELEQTLRERYARLLRNPSLTLVVKQVMPQRVFVAGEVRSPGELVLQPGLTALQAVSRAGFFTRDAEARNVVVLRYRGEARPEFSVLDMKALIDGQAGAAPDLALQPMDIVFVPQTQIAGLADFFGRYVGNIVPLWRNLGFSMVYYTNAARIQP